MIKMRSYCIYCGVTVEEGQWVCPLCMSDMSDEDIQRYKDKIRQSRKDSRDGAERGSSLPKVRKKTKD